MSAGKFGAALGSGATLLTVVLIFLKIFGAIDWSWFAVTAPWWGVLLVVIGIKSLLGFAEAVTP